MSEKRVVTLSKLYTKTGDDGSTGLVGGSRCAKDDLRVHSYGEVDELNACLGLVAQQADVELRQKVEFVQQCLFDLGAHLADGRDDPKIALGAQDIEQLESWVDAALEGLPILTSFVLPGGGELGARLHLARCVARRAERALVAANRQAPRAPQALHYLNRLSDLLFAWSRAAAHEQGAAELMWKPKNKG
ncbi:MAG: cob(I)yrinic acid a,c-diamide adenosyltransferase [Myxococcota bacterium]|nr:cob(I)yrinic acid a,c-diamide adenosyltransferase [Myxococcota bacterium]